MIEKWILSAKMKSCHQDLFFRLSPGEIRHNVGIHSHPSLIKYEFSIAQIYNILNKQTTFLAGFVQSYIFLNAFSLFDALVIDTIWFCHGKWWVIPGTEDMTEAYHDYAFHWKWFFIGLVSILPLALIIGGIVALIGVIV